MKTILFSLLLVAASCTMAIGQDVTESEFHVSGNCSQCKSRIEKAVTNIKGVKFARWNKSTKMLKAAFVTGTVTADSLQRRLAEVGHDTEAYKAPDDVYGSLPACCLYRNSTSTH